MDFESDSDKQVFTVECLKKKRIRKVLKRDSL